MTNANREWEGVGDSGEEKEERLNAFYDLFRSLSSSLPQSPFLLFHNINNSSGGGVEPKFTCCSLHRGSPLFRWFYIQVVVGGGG